MAIGLPSGTPLMRDLAYDPATSPLATCPFTTLMCSPVHYASKTPLPEDSGSSLSFSLHRNIRHLSLFGFQNVTSPAYPSLATSCPAAPAPCPPHTLSAARSLPSQDSLNVPSAFSCVPSASLTDQGSARATVSSCLLPA